ncbi:diphthine methyltransferase, putative [Plasmodium yoelii]|uniref:methylated diphthine methylhydrolase n=1 Tax=Plasmodium yoelii TaxID=5861 RepID=A0A077XZT6_PLAYE|nr:diphthine methyltransferase, putative [Plasmodium yoelii]CDU15910.1 conserved Plasmodium protein, unknown function [Plasmodium yoelii]VTZ71505.1 diphthine methyltransferase, putative [Plasmodium yoelii]|eukprot:XP_034493331.1 diphthine methyltransferase, putative [Plasmodium yoelii]
MIEKKYNLKYCCDDICVFPSITLSNYCDYKLSEHFGLTAISTYQLKTNKEEHNSEQKKKGKVYLYRLVENTNNNQLERESDYALIYEKNINYHSGVLQSSYLFANDNLMLGSICVNGLYLSNVRDGNYDKIVATKDEKNNSGLSFDTLENKVDKICVSFSNGDMSFISDGNPVNFWKAHEYHVWSCAFAGDENIITTGSDDCSFKIWDMRSKNCSQKNNRSHSQGVTVVKFESLSKTLYTGSYDNKIRIFDLRNIQDPLQTIDLKSSIWRIKFAYKNGSLNKLLVAMCDGGAQIIKKIKNEYIFKEGINNNNELTYGIDGIQILDNHEKKKKKKIYMSCSFYNKEAQLWFE